MPKKNKEDRTDWVAVEPDVSSSTTTNVIKKATNAYQYFQKEYSSIVRDEITQNGLLPFDIAQHGRLLRDKWNQLTDEEKEPYLQKQRIDQQRYAQESHNADIAALQRREQLQKSYNSISMLQDDDDEEDDNSDDDKPRRRATRGVISKQQKKKRRLERNMAKKDKKKRKKRNEEDDEEEDFDDNNNSDDDDDSDSGSWDSNESSSDDDDDDDDDSEEDEIDGEKKKKEKKKKKIKKKKPITPPRRVATQKQLEHREKVKKEKVEKEEYISGRQENLNKEKSEQAKRRLEFLLKQSNIFSHFGAVKEDAAKYGKAMNKSSIGEDDNDSKNNMDDDNDDEENPSNKRSRRGGDGSAKYDDQKDDVDNDKILEEADENETIYLTQQPSTLGFGQMRQYQLEGLNWMIGLQENGVNGILADEMGLGKTLQSISSLVYMMEYRNDNGPHLIIVPKSTLSNWMNEIGRWGPTLKSIKFHGSKDEREEFVKTYLDPAARNDNDRTWNVLITTYEIVNLEKARLLKFAWSYLIVDEAHRLKNEGSVFSKTVRLLETRYRILLTGTPLQNSLHELWALLNFLVPDVFASSEQFDEWFNLDIDDDKEKSALISQLHKILRPFMLRRLKVDVEKSLPPKHETILYTGMSVMQKKLYRDILIRDIDAINGITNTTGSNNGGGGGSGGGGNRTAILNIVMQLRKCAGHPYLFPGVEDRSLPPLGEHIVENCGKMVLLDKLLKYLHVNGHRVLLFTQMTKVLDIMEDYLVMRKFKYCRIDGNTSYDDRENFIDAYNAPNSEKFLFLLSTRAGGLGINLQTADIVILYDSDWNPQADLQAQDRAHRIGQKRPVQVFRLVTEHTIEEKIVERAQQKLKLDAMVVQTGRLKDKDSKLSREELLSAVRFGADKIFKSKDSSITDDDIEMIMDAGKRKTQELNDKLKAADKGDLLDFKLDGSNVQTFEGVDYSRNALAQAKADAGILGIFDIGKRERKEANYNENSLYQRQITAIQGERKPKLKKIMKLPKSFRLPRMEEWQMFDRDRLMKIQEEEEEAFKELPEDVQRLAYALDKGESVIEAVTDGNKSDDGAISNELPKEVPPLLSDETREEKEKMLSEGFTDWNRHDYSQFVKSSAKYGRIAIDKIAIEVRKPESDITKFSDAFWGETGKRRISELEYDRVVKLIEKGEKKITEIKSLRRATGILIHHFDNPWRELEFVYVNCKDKMFTAEEDRHLLCWSYKYGYGQWMAIKFAIRRSPAFRFDYFLRSLPIDQVARRCEQLMKATEKEVEHLERKARELLGLPTEAPEGEILPPVQVPKFRELQRHRHIEARAKAEKERKELEDSLADIESQIKEAQARLKSLNEGIMPPPGSSADVPVPVEEKSHSRRRSLSVNQGDARKPEETISEMAATDAKAAGTIGPQGKYLEFPEYGGIEHPVEWKKPFFHFCIHTKKDVKAELDPEDRKDKNKISVLLKEKWLNLSADDKATYREWTEWDKKRFAHEMHIFQSNRVYDEEVAAPIDDDMQQVHVPKKRKQVTPTSSSSAIPKKKKA